jgi:hypothetical protein
MDEHRRQSDVSRISKALDADDDRRRSVALSAPVVHQRSGKMGRVASFFGGDKEEVESLRNQLAAGTNHDSLRCDCWLSSHVVPHLQRKRKLQPFEWIFKAPRKHIRSKLTTW